MIELSLPLEEKDGKIKIPCPICKGEHEGIHHTMSCDNGWVWVNKEKLIKWLQEDESNKWIGGRLVNKEIPNR